MTFRNEKGILPEITIHFHWQLLLALVMLPTTFFMLLAIGYARRQLQTPALRLLKKSPTPIKVQRRKRAPKKDKSFLKELSSSLIWGEKIYLVFCSLWLYVFCGHGSIVLWLKRLHG